MELELKWSPAEEFSDGVSQPRACEEPWGGCLVAKSSMVSGWKSLSEPGCRSAWAKRSRSGTLEKRPAWPPAPLSR